MGTVVSIGYREREKILPTQTDVTVGKGVDFFDKIIGSEGSRFQLGSDVLTLPATKEVDRILNRPASHDAKPGVLDLDAAIFHNSINFYNGLARFSTAQRSGRPSTYSLQLIGNGRDFWEQCAGLTMHDLDLGNIVVNRGTIKNSWTGSYLSGLKYIFAPVLYGKPSGLVEPEDEEPAFADEDFRPHIYFPAIVDAIGVATGYRIQGQILGLPIFRESVYLCTRRASDIQQILPPYCQVSLLRTSTKAFVNGAALDFDVTNGCSYVGLGPGGNPVTAGADMDLRITLNMSGSTISEILVYVNGLHDSIKFTSENGTFITQTIILPVEAGDVITFLAVGTGGGITVTFASMLMERVFNPDILVDKTIRLSTAMHPHSVKDFINAISHQFGLLWLVNTKTRTIEVKPRFNFKLGGIQYRGHYDILGTPGDVNAGQDDITYQTDDYFGRHLDMAYKQDGQYLFKVLASANQQDCPVGGIRMEIEGSQGSGQSNLNPLFAYLPQLKYGRFTSLPAILGDDYDGNSTDIPETWTGAGVITCGLVYRNNATIMYDEGNGVPNQYDAPWISQHAGVTPNARPLDKPYQIGYCDTGDTPGLIRLFYWQYLSCIRNPETVRFTTRMGVAEFDAFTFAGTYKARMGGGNMGQWIALSISAYSPATMLGQMSMIKLRPITDAVIAAIENYEGA